MRRLSRRKALSLVKELDAFPKVADSYMETSASGGTVSIIAFCAIAVLAILEFFVYRDTWMKYDYEVDKDFSSKLRINVDVTVAMKCQHVGADILDLAETMITSNGLQYEPVIFELSPQQRLWQRMLRLLQSRLREEHAVQEVLYKTLLKGAPTALPPREDAPNEPLNGCRIYGHAYVNKVAGNLHITVGKPIHHPQGHAHIAAFVSHEAYNFSHRIDHLSFGEEVPGIINPLDGTEKITYNNNQMYQYFITVVPTKLNTHLISADTHQFSVTERERVINHAAGSHGVSGIFVKYDTSSLMVTVSEQHMALGRFLVRLCGIVGGIFSTTGESAAMFTSYGSLGGPHSVQPHSRTSMRLFVHPSKHPSICPLIIHPNIHSFIHLSTHPTKHSSIHPCFLSDLYYICLKFIPELNLSSFNMNNSRYF